MIASEYHADLKEVQSDRALSRLLTAPAQNAPFDRIEWWQGLADHCGLDPRLAIAREGEATAVLPLREESGELRALSNWYTFRFRPIVSPGANAPALVGAIAANLARRTSRMSLSGLCNEDGSADLVQHAFRDAGWIVMRKASDVNHVLRLAGRSWEEYLASRPGPLRTTLKRKSGKVAVEVLTRFDVAAWADYEDIYAESWKPSEGSPAFLRDFAEREGAEGRLRLGIARADGRAVAAQLWTVEGGSAFIHKLAHREDAKPLSPGSVLSAALFRHVIDVDRVDIVDFGTGDDGYKRDWMEEVRPRFTLEMFRARDPRNWPVLTRRIARSLAAKSKRG